MDWHFLLPVALTTSDNFVIKLLRHPVLDAVVLGDDPLVVVLVVAAGKRARVFRLPFGRSADARDKGEHSFPEMLLDKVLVEIERGGADQPDVVAHQALEARLTLLLRRLRVRIPVVPVAACVEAFLFDLSRFVFDD